MDTPPINRLPLGMLDFFSLKNGGQYPQHLGTNLQPVIDYTTQYALPSSIAVFTSSNIPASTAPTSIAITATGPIDLTNGVELRVPQSEVWLVMEAYVRWGFTAAANQFGDMYLTATDGGAGQLPFAMSDIVGFSTSDATIGRGGMRAVLSPRWLRYGSEIRVGVSGFQLTAPSDWQFGMRVARFLA